MSPLTSITHDESGQALVEFALVLPLLLLLVLGMVDFGKAYNYWNDATHLTAEAARFAAVNRKPDPADPCRCSARSSTRPTPSSCVRASHPLSSRRRRSASTFPTAHRPSAIPVRVRMTFTYHFLPFIGAKVGALTHTITSSTVMRLEAVPSTYSAGCT